MQQGVDSANYGLGDPYGVATDNAGNIFETGEFEQSVYFGSSEVTTHIFSAFGGDVYLVKYDANGNVLWARNAIVLGEYCYGMGYAVATDKAGDAYITGIFQDTINFGGHALISNGYTSQGDVFLVKYDANGNVVWTDCGKLSGSQSKSYGNAVTVDAFGNIYVVGMFLDQMSIGANSLNTGFTNNDGFIAKYSPGGSVIWVKTCQLVNSASSADFYGVSTDAAGNVYIAGSYSGSVTLGVHTLANSNNGGILWAKYDSSGTVLWAKNAAVGAGNNSNAATALTIDGAGNLYMSGSFQGSIFVGPYSLVDISSITDNAFIAKFNPSGNIVWAQNAKIPASVSSVNSFSSLSLAADKWENIYMSGMFNDSVSFGSVNLGSGTYNPSFIFKFDSAGNALCGTFVTNGNDDGYGLAADPTGPNVYFTSDAYQTCYFGGSYYYGIGDEWAFLGKWTCGGCTILPAITGDTAICSGQSVTLVASGGTSYVWSNGDTTSSITIAPASTITYNVTVNDSVCTANTSHSITVYQPPIPSVSAMQTICKGGSVALSSGGGSRYNWIPPTGLSSASVADPIANPLSTTTYTVSIINGQCIVKDSVVVIVNNAPVTNVCCDSVIRAGQTVQLTSSGGGTYLWAPSNGLNCNTCSNPVASPNTNTTYTLIVTSDSGCSTSSTITIDVVCGTVFIPEAFSPNGDGQNDVLYVRGDCIKTMQFDVFDRWGNRVFETSDKNIGWNGMYKGDAMNTGSYVYSITATMYDGTIVSKKGNVALVR